MFKFRSGGQGGSSPTQPPSIETVRRRARHRLLGASLLVLAGVIGFPLLFESQPRPVQSNFEIEIPARKSVPPLAVGSPATAPAGRVEGLDEKEEVIAAAAPVAAASMSPAAPAPAATPVQVSAATPGPQVVKPWEKTPTLADKPAETRFEAEQPVAAPKPVAEARPAPEKKIAEAKPVEKKPVEPKPAAKAANEEARALALLEGRAAPQKPASDDNAPAKDRFIVQVGAFVDPALAQAARQKLEQSGLTTYTQIGNTPDGPRTRVRLGPFATRAEAEKAAAKARTQGLAASILKL